MNLRLNFSLLFKHLLRNALMTVIFYIVSWIIFKLMNIYSPAGPCVPGGGDMLFILLIPVVITLFVINAYKTFAVSVNYTISLLLHLAVILWILYSICS